MASLLSIAALVTAVQALALEGRHPEPTLSSKPDPTFQFPKITLPPSIQDLAKRQNGQTVLVGPDNTCGYFDGRPGAAFSCNGKDVTCALVTTANIGAVGCCDQDDCGLRVACVDYREFVYSSAHEMLTTGSTRSSAPFCATVTFFSGIVDYYCDTLSDSTPQQLYTTWHGESDGRTFTPVVVTLDESVATSPFASATQTSGDDEDEDSRTSSSGSTGATAPANNEEDSSNPSNPSSKSSTNVGAIAGGVVGGVAGLALIGLGIFFLIRHNNKKKRNITGQQPAPQMQQGPGTGMPPTQPGAAAAGYQQPPYNPHYSQQYSPPPPGYPQQAYYADQNKPGGFASVAPAAAQLPDRNDSTSPTNSQFTDNRQSIQQQPTSPTSTINSNWQQNQPYPGQQSPPIPNVPPTVHEAGGNVVGERNYNDNHHGQLHELGS
ncbi:hypothetical protein Daesc_003007 [Daldinia eschscholtzii]|uniref:Uncharacterized protein n=1 Tax=Daldinia eschscholtzii TaxID=292717 RepID=A0AAX6MT63_9PEZI